MFYAALSLWHKTLKESPKEKKLCENPEIVLFCIAWSHRIFKYTGKEIRIFYRKIDFLFDSEETTGMSIRCHF